MLFKVGLFILSALDRRIAPERTVTNPDSVRPVPDNTIIAYVLPGVKQDVTRSIRPCRPSRDWMDQTPGQYAYRCIPLSAANTMGWEILNPVDVRIRWSGMDSGDTIDVERKADNFIELEELKDVIGRPPRPVRPGSDDAAPGTATVASPTTKLRMSRAGLSMCS